ncbi:MAG: hypothetical protein IPL61_26815 [Myxococcales bacterium]|nr:hypothetical protein [Myxococcales bacterium]
MQGRAVVQGAAVAMPLVAVHRALDEVFARVRELLLIGDGARAAAVLTSYRALTEAHAAAEEAALVPLLDARARWPAELYLGQHRKLFEAIDRLAAACGAVVVGAPGWRTAALAALDAAVPLHHLAEHHHLAEEQDLFAVVAAQAPERLADVAAQFWVELDGHRAILEDADLALAR